MGMFCSKPAVVDRSPSEITLQNGFGDRCAIPCDSSGKGQCFYSTVRREEHEKGSSGDPYLFAGKPDMSGFGITETGAGQPKVSRASSQKSKPAMEKPSTSRKSRSTKVAEVGSLLGRAGSVGFGKAVNMLDIVGSSITNLNSGSGFGLGGTTKGNKILILAFEVANTIVKGYNLMESLSQKNISYLKEVVLISEGVQHLVTNDIGELLRLAAADKREELKVFSGEIVRFGNHCKDPQWHNLERHFSKLEFDIPPGQQLKEMALEEIHWLMTLVHDTSELYHELHALDKYEQDYKQKVQEESNLVPAERVEADPLSYHRQFASWRQPSNTKTGAEEPKEPCEKLKEEITLVQELGRGKQVVMKLVDIVHFLHLEINEVFGTADGDKPVEGSDSSYQRIGPAGLALHYANIITQIDTLASRSSSVPPNTRDALYQNLPPCVKSALRSRLQILEVKEELTVPQIKSEMEKTLRWLIPMANNTSRAHHGFGWVGEWANRGIDMNKFNGHADLIRIKTLYHADKKKTEAYILDLVVWLHQLITQSRPGNTGIRSPTKSPIHSYKRRRSPVSSTVNEPQLPPSRLTLAEQEMLEGANFRRQTPRRSKSQEFETGRGRLRKDDRLSKSSSDCLPSETITQLSSMRRQLAISIIDFDIDRIKVLDIIDRVDNLTYL